MTSRPQNARRALSLGPSLLALALAVPLSTPLLGCADDTESSDAGYTKGTDDDDDDDDVTGTTVGDDDDDVTSTTAGGGDDDDDDTTTSGCNTGCDGGTGTTSGTTTDGTATDGTATDGTTSDVTTTGAAETDTEDDNTTGCFTGCYFGSTDTGGGTDGYAAECCVPEGAIGCSDRACEAAVCGVDPFCCAVEGDATCVGIAVVEPACDCPGPATSSGGVGATSGAKSNCCVFHGGSGCEDPACEASVCALDPFCCSVEWDDICVGHAEDDPSCICEGTSGGTAGTTTGTTGEPSRGDCCDPHAGTGCGDADCEAAVCSEDPCCCSVEWDDICVDLASGRAECDCFPSGCFTSGGGPECCEITGDPCDCCEPGFTLGCEADIVCETIVCSIDPFCCSFVWDAGCVEVAGTVPECGCDVAPTTGGAGDCCVSNGTPGCDEPACEAIVCADDPFCCSIEWDGICVGAAQLVFECGCSAESGDPG